MTEPTEEEKRKTIFWDGVAAVLFIAAYLVYVAIFGR